MTHNCVHTAHTNAWERSEEKDEIERYATRWRAWKTDGNQHSNQSQSSLLSSSRNSFSSRNYRSSSSLYSITSFYSSTTFISSESIRRPTCIFDSALNRRTKTKKINLKFEQCIYDKCNQRPKTKPEQYSTMTTIGLVPPGEYRLTDRQSNKALK